MISAGLEDVMDIWSGLPPDIFSVGDKFEIQTVKIKSNDTVLSATEMKINLIESIARMQPKGREIDDYLNCCGCR